MKYDDVLINYVGEFGRYQKIQCFLVCIPAMMTSMQVLSWTFAAADLDLRCQYPNEGSGYSATYINEHLNLTEKNDKEVYLKYQCERPKNISIDQININSSSLPSESCVDGYVYDNSDITNSAINRWELSCDRYFIKAVIQSLYYLGQGIGSLVFGIISDKIGRKKTFLMAITLQSVAGLGMAVAPWWWLFGILRMIVGFGHPGIFVVSVVIGMELVGPSKRFIGGIVTGLFFALGQVILGAIAYGVRDYQMLMLVISVPYVVFISYIWLVPESARWLMSQGRNDEANEILMKAAKCNGRELPEHVLKEVDLGVKPTSDKKYGFLDLFRFPRIRRRTLLSYYCWFAVSGVYYGISMNPNVYGGNRYVTFILAGIAEAPGILLSSFFVNRLGRKLLLVLGYSLTALLMFITLTIDEDRSYILTTFVILAKASIKMTYAIVYVYTPELYPTVLRNTSTGSCSMIARVGAFSASYVAMYLVKYSKIAVILIFGCFSVSAAIVVVFQPETSGLKLAETVEEAEQIGKYGNIWSFKPQHPPTSLKSDEEEPAAEELKELKSEIYD